MNDAPVVVEIEPRHTVAARRAALGVVLVGSAMMFFSGGIRSGFGLFVDPIGDETGWTTAQISLGIAVQNLMWGLGQPFAGALADRYGSGRVLASGGALYVAGVFLMGQASGPGEWVLSSGLLVGLALAGASLSVVLAAVGRAVPAESRSMALGIVTAAMSAGQFVLVPVTRWLIASRGIEGAFTSLAVVASVMILLAGAMTGRAQQGDGSGAADRSARAALADAAAHRGYVLLTIGFFVCGFHVMFMATHIPKHIEENGLSDDVGAWTLALIGLFNIIGSLAAGHLGSRHRMSGLLAGLYLARAVVIALFVIIPISATSSLVFGAAIGLLWLSTVPLTSGLVAKMFGPENAGLLFGIVFLSHQLGSFLGIWLGGKLFDVTGSFTVTWWIAVVLGLVAAILHWPIDEPPVETQITAQVRSPSANAPAGADG